MDSRIKTERRAWTPKARVYHYAVDHVIEKGDVVLDFGSGKARYWEGKLCKRGYKIDSYDLSLTHQPASRYHTVILISNVLNVQETKAQLEDTLAKVISFAKHGTRIVWNYPSPRKMDLLSVTDIEHYLTAAIEHEGFTPMTTRLKGEHAGLNVTTLI